MGALIYFMHTTLDNRISAPGGTLWTPFSWGEPEMTYNNELFGEAGTWVFGRITYEAIVPWWETVVGGELPDDAGELTEADRQFATIQHGMSKIVLSRSWPPDGNLSVISDAVPDRLADVKSRTDQDVFLSCGPETLEPLAAVPGLIDQYVLPVHPVALGDGPRLFSTEAFNMKLKLLSAKAFADGCVVLRYKTIDRTD
jgi:dihydrofolate reductase